MCGLCYFFVILPIVTHVSSSTVRVFSRLGDNVTLPCSYDTQTHSVQSFCWGRGKVPMSKCSNTILSSEDGAVLYRQAPRYQLRGRVTDGDVSLTIVDAQWGDAGTYGCRVEIPGWFNDYKLNIHLSVEEVPVEQPPTEDWMLATSVAQEMTPTPTSTYEQYEDLIFKTPEEEPLLAERKTYSVAMFEEKIKEFFKVENISRMAVFLFVTLTVILLFAFWKKFQPRSVLKNVDASATENIYESVPMSSQEQRNQQNP